jgi:hypothetical protein
MKLFTIGFTETSAAGFFGRLQAAGVTRLIDVRLNRRSQLAGFAKEGDLAYFAQAICGIETEAVPELAPTPDMLGPIAPLDQRGAISTGRLMRRSSSG